MSDAEPSNRLQSLPVKPLRLLKVFAVQALCRVPLYGMTVGGILFLAALGLPGALGGNGIAGIGWWPLTVAFTALGAVLGGLAGLISAVENTLRAAEEDARTWLSRLPDIDGRRLIPTVELDQLEGGYEDAIASLCGTMLGRLPLPAIVRRGIESKFRHAVVDDFLESCRARGATAVGFAELRDFALEKALPLATRPAHAQLRVAVMFLLGIAGVCAAAPLVVALVAGAANPRLAVIATAAAVGILVLFLGWRRADTFPFPRRRRIGVLIIGGGLALWPIIWIELLPHDLGMVWILVLAATLWTLQRGARMAIWEANGLSLRTFHRLGA